MTLARRVSTSFARLPNSVNELKKFSFLMPVFIVVNSSSAVMLPSAVRCGFARSTRVIGTQ